MLTVLLTAKAARAPRFYRVVVEYNLFGEYSVIREWGRCGQPGTRLLAWFSNIADACRAADRAARRAVRRGYQPQPPAAGGQMTAAKAAPKTV